MSSARAASPVVSRFSPARIAWLVLGTFALVGLFVAVWFPRTERAAAFEALQHKARTQARLVAFTIAPAVDFGDAEVVREAFRGAALDADFVGIRARGPDGVEVDALGELDAAPDRVVVEEPITLASGGSGQLRLVMSTARIDAQSARQSAVSWGIGLTILALGVLVALWVARTIRAITALMEENAAARLAAEQANIVKTRFLANMSHEMRTPLNGVLGLTDVLSRRALDAGSRELVRAMGRSARTLLALVNDILDLSRVEAGRLELETAPFDPEAAVLAVGEMLQPGCDAKGIDLVVEVAESVPRSVSGDRLRFEQVLTNLAGNAVKFTSAGSVRIRLTHAAGALQVSVVDTGIGIADDKLATIFDAFTQADTSTTRRFGGSGLGLAIARQIVRRMGGDIEVVSRPGEGSTFSFSMATDAPAAGPTPVPPRFERALVVAAHGASRDMLGAHASRRGLRVEMPEPAGVEAALGEAGRGTVVLWDARSDANERALAGAVERGARVLVHVALGDDARRPGVAATVLRRPFSRETFDHVLDGAEEASVAEPDATRRALRARLLIAEDDETNRLVVESFLGELGVRAEMVGDGLAAVERVTEGAPLDVILMDCQMPRLDGYEAARRIRAWEAETGRARTPIVAVTAHALPAERARAMAVGMDGYVTKPLTLETLRAALLEHVGEAPVSASSDARLHVERSGDAALARKLRESFARGSQEGLDALAEALGKADFDAVRSHAHKLKGSCLSLGAEDAGAIAAKLEAAARASDAVSASELLVRLEVAVADVQARLDDVAGA